VGGAVETLAGVGAEGFGPGCSFTSLGTIAPFPVSGTFGRPASAEDDASAPAGVWGGGSALERPAHPENNDDAAATISAALTDFFAMPPS
jgi:hypothetical protein